MMFDKRIIRVIDSLKNSVDTLHDIAYDKDLELNEFAVNWLFAQIEMASSAVNTALQFKNMVTHWHWSVNRNGKIYEKDTGGWVNSREEAILKIETALSEIRPGVAFEWVNDSQCCYVGSRYGTLVDGVISRRSFIEEVQLEDY